MISKIPKNKFRGPFNLKFTLDSEQCPSDRWSLEGNKYKTFFNLNNQWIPVLIWDNSDSLFIDCKKDISKKILYHFWADYNLLDFYSKFAKDQYFLKVTNSCYGLRVMRDFNIKQRIIEAILTQNSSVKQIRKTESKLKRSYGDGYNFNLKKIKNAKKKGLQQCGVGYRARYLKDAAKKILSGKLSLEKIKQTSSKNARELLLEIDGVGPKVADIILLYGFGKSDVFPMDVWLRRTLIREYFKGGHVTDKELREFALNYFGGHAGIAHLYIFYYERKRKSAN